MASCIALLGFMGSGKTSTGRVLAHRLGFRFLDTDVVIEQVCGMPVREIFRLKGEPFFREMEARTLRESFASESSILATGGGLWLNEGNRKLLSDHAWCVWLRVSPLQAWERVRPNLEERPLLANAPDPLQKVRELIGQREPVYAQAHCVVETDGLTPEAVADDILRRMKEQKPFDLPAL